MKKHLFLLVLLFLMACTSDDSVVEVTRLGETAVSPTASPTTIVPTATMLALQTATAVPATVAPPSATPFIDAASTAVPISTPAISLSEFLSSLQDKLNARDFDALKEMMPARFVLGTHPD